MTTRTSSAQWRGDLKSGAGELEFGGGSYRGKYTFASRFESGEGTNPEELLAAAHAACFTMALSNMLAQDGHPADQVSTEATVHLGKVDDAPTITKVVLETTGEVPGIDEATFRKHAEAAKAGCPVSKLFAGADIELEISFRG